MKTGRIGVRFVLASLLCLGLSTGCSDDDDDGIRVAITGSHSVAVGATLNLTATTTGGTDTSYTWASSDTDIATVDASGIVTGVANGEADVTATGNQTGAVGVHAVVVGGAGSAVQVTGAVSLLLTQTTKLAASPEGTYTWASSDETVATVSSDGTVTAIAPGVVTITATNSDTQASGSFTMLISAETPNESKWEGSGHADYQAEAFRHWDEDGEIPTFCARCHSTGGYLDYLGEDGSDVEKVDKAAALGTVIECKTCHNTSAEKLDFVTFPGKMTNPEDEEGPKINIKLTGLGPEAICMTCHQGRASSDSVDESITEVGLTDDDTPEADDKLGEDNEPNLGFINIHYYAAGATLNAGRVRGGYQYEGQVYDWRFRHVPTHDTCVECHDPHSLEVRLDECKECHDTEETTIETLADLKKIRMIASKASDFDGDGDLEEGIHGELQGLRAKLFTGIQNYAKENTNIPEICYASAYPYFFVDTDKNGECNGEEAGYGNRYLKWTNRLLRAAYNYQVSTKDPGAFAHNAKYIIQLLYDSIMDLNASAALTTKVDMTNTVRNDPGHFNGAGEAARHWDEDETVSQDCSQCHGGAEGFRFFLEFGVGKTDVEPDNGLDCATCHDNVGRPAGEDAWKLASVTSVELPGGGVYQTKDDSDPPKVVADVNNICGTCHIGRESKATIDKAIANNEKRDRFMNVHYKSAFATMLGTEGKVGYEYDGKSYVGKWTPHPEAADECVECHSPKNTNHSFDVADNIGECQVCHSGITSVDQIRATGAGDFTARVGVDYDGDGDSDESLHDEILGLAQRVLLAMHASSGQTICRAENYPYFFKDNGPKSADGRCDTGENGFGNRYQFDLATATDQRLVKAGHNYQIAIEEPGAWAHNFDYIHQLLYDSLVDLGVDVTGLDLPKPPGR